MKRPWQVWLIFAGCTLLVLTAMGWLSGHAILSDWQRSQAEWEVQREQQIRLALWRMDTKLAPLIAEEAARPHYFYDSFYAIDGPPTKAGLSSQWAPSPLLFQTKNVRLNFYNSGATDQWSSPQVPRQEFNELAVKNGLLAEQLQENRVRLADLARQVDPQQLLAQLPREQIPALPPPARADRYGDANESGYGSEYGGGYGSDEDFTAENPFDDSEQQTVQSPATQQGERPPIQSRQQIALPQAKNTNNGKLQDYRQRSSRYQGVAQQEFAKQRSGNFLGNYANAFPAPNVPEGEGVVESLSQPLWVNGELLLARRISRDGQEGVQGSWLDWPNLKRELLEEVIDLFPVAELRPLPDPEAGDASRMLAGLPVEFHVPFEKGLYFPSAALRWTLGLGWLALLTALGSVAALLWGVLALSERRATFVSSVTHELRTPLTTFRMYADMLARDMVPDPARRQEYLTTLQREAERLTHLVENVLSYARLERGRGPSSREQISVAELIERQQTRLAERAAQAEMQLEIVLPDTVRGLSLTTDVGVVEQILFNLVDNAAKYAVGAKDRRIEFAVQRVDHFVEFTIRDHGPGFDKTRQARNPQPFSKSAEEAAVSAPGVGLGLALCRRLAKQLGGRLEISPGRPGATVSLFLSLG